MQTNQLLSSNQIKQQIKLRKFPQSHQAILDQLFNIIRFFFVTPRDESEVEIPFRGFLLNGNPASGKTEMVKQLALRLGKDLKEEGIEVKFIAIDSKAIAKARWGESEQSLASMFEDYDLRSTDKKTTSFYADANEKVIYLFDDIDCFFFDRNCSVSMEWNYAVSSTFFHILDNLNPYNRMIIGTSNNTKIMDNAMLSRFYKIMVPDYTQVELLEIATIMAKKLKSVAVLPKIKQTLAQMPNPSMRDVENLILNQYIQEISTIQIPKRTEVAQYAVVKVYHILKYPSNDGVILLKTDPTAPYRQCLTETKIQPSAMTVFNADYEEWEYHLPSGDYQIRSWNPKNNGQNHYSIRVLPSYRIENL